MKLWHNDIFDNGFNAAKINADKMVLCKQPPTTFIEGNNLDTDGSPGFKVAEVAMASGDFTIQDRTGGGREMVVALKSSVTALDDSIVTDDLHIALLDTVNSKLLIVTDETSDQEITTGNPVNFPSWTTGNPDPV